MVEFLSRGPVKTWALTQSIVDELHDAYPDLDIVAEAKRARAWLAATPARTPTARGMRAFVTRWLSRSQDSPRGDRPALRVVAGRDIRVGHVRAEDCHHDGRTGEIPL